MAACAIFIILFLLRVFHKVINEFIPQFLIKRCSLERKLTEDLKQQKHQILLINVQDEFAKYAKLQRQIKKQQEQLSDKATERQKQGLKTKGILWFISTLFCVFMHFWILWPYKSAPVVILPNQWLYPLNTILKFPTVVDGAIGLPCWICICNAIIVMLQSF